MSKLKLGLYWAASCGGCEISFLEIHEKILDILEVVDIVFWPCILDFKYKDVEAMPDGAIDVCLFNGAIRNEENERIARLLRRKSKILVAHGACSMLGGIPGLANLFTREEILDRVYVTTESTDNPEGTIPRGTAKTGDGGETELPDLYAAARALDQVVDVDYTMPGCPPAEHQTWAVCQAIAAGNLPPAGSIIGAGEKTVCDECTLVKEGKKVGKFMRPHEVLSDGRSCLMEQGIVCLGPATRSGCGAQCMTASMPCRGCYGPAGEGGDQGSKMVDLLGSLVDSDEEEKIHDTVDGVADPAGSFYRFSLPTSILGRSNKQESTRLEQPSAEELKK